MAAQAPAAALQDELLLERTMAAGRAPVPGRPDALSAAVRGLRRVDRFPGSYLARLVEIGLVALLGFQCITLYRAAAMPLKPAAAEPVARLPPSTILASYDSIFAGAGGVDAPTPAAAGLKLHGIRQDGRGGGGSAIISGADGPQRSFGVGESISPGLVLKEVGPGYATVARHGVDERLAFADFGSPASGTRPPSRIVPSTRATTAASRAPGSPAPAAGRGSSINFADPSTLPSSLNPPAG